MKVQLQGEMSQDGAGYSQRCSIFVLIFCLLPSCEVYVKGSETLLNTDQPENFHVKQ